MSHFWGSGQSIRGWSVSVILGDFGEGWTACFDVNGGIGLEQIFAREHDHDTEVSLGAGVGLAATSSSETMY